jgi:hypothetical protein
MPTEKDFETLLVRYPELIEDGLRLLGRQVTVHGRRMDLLFEDRFGRQLITELKWGPIKDEHIGQLMCYEGLLLSADDPTLRVMLIGTRVPPNIRRTLDHHGIAWKEITAARISSFLVTRGDPELVPLFVETDRPELTPKSLRLKPDARQVANLASPGAEAALFVPIEGKWLEAAFNYFRSGGQELYLVTNAAIGRAANLQVRHVYFKVKGDGSVSAQASFVDVRTDNPASKRLPGNENVTGRYYYGICNIKRLTPPLELGDLRYFKTGTPLRNDVPGACIIQEPAEIPAQA